MLELQDKSISDMGTNFFYFLFLSNTFGPEKKSQIISKYFEQAPEHIVVKRPIMPTQRYKNRYRNVGNNIELQFLNQVKDTGMMQNAQSGTQEGNVGPTFHRKSPRRNAQPVLGKGPKGNLIFLLC